jgi:hypothetical protein
MFQENFLPNRIILSIIGSVNHLTMDERTKNAFENGFSDALKWQQLNKYETIILTGGTDIGVSRLIGDVVDHEFFSPKSIKVIGITSLEKLLIKQKLVYSSDEKILINVSKLVYMN